MPARNSTAKFLCFTLLLLLLPLAPLSAQTAASNDPYQLPFTVSEAPEWTQLFHRQSGWIGADGIYSIPLTGSDQPGRSDSSRTLFIFSDTIYGNAESKGENTGFHMINNSYAILN